MDQKHKSTESTEETKIEDGMYCYLYSSAQREEMDAIRRKYLPREQQREETDGLARLREIDARVERVGTVCALCIGVVGLLLLGLGMCGVLVWMGIWFALGIPVGLLGIGIMAAAYPIYQAVTRGMREKYAPEVMQITEATRE